MTEWWRGRDDHGRIHTFAIRGEQIVHYFPDEEGHTFGFSHRMRIDPVGYD